MALNQKELKKAIASAQELSCRLANLELYLAGTPDEIKIQLEALQVQELSLPEGQP